MTMVFADTPDQGRQEFDQSEIRSIPFFPVIDLTNFREVMRIEANISSSRVYHAALEAVAHVNGQLKKYRISAVQVGKSTLAETGDSDDVINGESVKTIHYRRAVYCYAKSLLLEKYADTEPSGKAGERADYTPAEKAVLTTLCQLEQRAIERTINDGGDDRQAFQAAKSAAGAYMQQFGQDLMEAA